MPNVYEVAMQFRADLLRQERAAASQMVRYYGAIYQRVQSRIAALNAEIAEGKESPALLSQKRLRLQGIQREIESDLTQFATWANQQIAMQQAQATEDGQSNARELMKLALPEGAVHVAFRGAPPEAIQRLIGALADGSPLSKLLNRIAPEGADAAGKVLASGFALGQHPRVIAKDIRAALGVGLSRALTISRTETLRAYREAARQTYAANSDVVSKWRWLCAKSARTCAVCLAMDGREFDTDVMMASHVNCRCALVPITSLSESTRETGAEWFAKQDAKTQETVLGPGKLAAYRDGKITLGNLVQEHESAEWGPSRTEKSLSAALDKTEK